MNCSTCGTPLEPGAAFCVTCGTRAPAPTDSAGKYTTQLQDPYVPQLRLPESNTPVVAATEWGNYAAATPRTSELAIVSLVCGILGIVQVLPIVGPIAAIVTGHLARRDIRQAGDAKTGAGMALAGLIMGYIMLALYFFLCVLGVLFIAYFANAR